MRHCQRCENLGREAWHDESAFGRNARRRDGLTIYCLICHAELSAEWRANNPDRSVALEAAKTAQRAALRTTSWPRACHYCGHPIATPAVWATMIQWKHCTNCTPSSDSREGYDIDF